MVLVSSLEPALFEGSESRTLESKAGNAVVSLPAPEFLFQYELPNFLFHLTAAYSILRSRVAIGKADFDGFIVSFVYGYPAGTATGIVPMVTTPSGDWKQRASVYSGAWVYAGHGAIDEDAGTAQRCFVRYRQPTAAGNAPVIDYVSTG